MKKHLIRVLCAFALVALGWAAARAQDSVAQPDFVLDIEAPQGMTKVVCVRGCELIAARSADGSTRMSYFEYGCGVNGDLTPSVPRPGLRCKGTAYGWQRR